MTTRSDRGWHANAGVSGIVARAVMAVAVHPSLWLAAMRQARRLARDRWWARPPFLPLPSLGYVAFRMQTQYGDPRHRLEPDDVIQYLRWCRSLDAIERTAALRPTSRPPISRAPSGVSA